MARKKYIYNTQTLDYEEYKPSLTRRLFNVFLFVFAAGIIGIFGVTIIENQIGTPKERIQAREIEFLQFLLHYFVDRLSAV